MHHGHLYLRRSEVLDLRGGVGTLVSAQHFPTHHESCLRCLVAVSPVRLDLRSSPIPTPRNRRGRPAPSCLAIREDRPRRAWRSGAIGKFVYRTGHWSKLVESANRNMGGDRRSLRDLATGLRRGAARTPQSHHRGQHQRGRRGRCRVARRPADAEQSDGSELFRRGGRSECAAGRGQGLRGRTGRTERDPLRGCV